MTGRRKRSRLCWLRGVGGRAPWSRRRDVGRLVSRERDLDVWERDLRRPLLTSMITWWERRGDVEREIRAFAEAWVEEGGEAAFLAHWDRWRVWFDDDAHPFDDAGTAHVRSSRYCSRMLSTCGRSQESVSVVPTCTTRGWTRSTASSVSASCAVSSSTRCESESGGRERERFAAAQGARPGRARRRDRRTWPRGRCSSRAVASSSSPKMTACPRAMAPKSRPGSVPVGRASGRQQTFVARGVGALCHRCGSGSPWDEKVVIWASSGVHVTA
jgi:hypothetical protein